MPKLVPKYPAGRPRIKQVTTPTDRAEAEAKVAGLPQQKRAVKEPVASEAKHFILPYPPGANRYWRNVGGRTILSAEARAYRAKVQGLLQSHEPLTGEVAVTLHFYRPQRSGDLDGRLKQLLDALQGFAYINDSQIVAISATRYEDKNNPRVEVLVVKK